MIPSFCFSLFFFLFFLCFPSSLDFVYLHLVSHQPFMSSPFKWFPFDVPRHPLMLFPFMLSSVIPSCCFPFILILFILFVMFPIHLFPISIFRYVSHHVLILSTINFVSYHPFILSPFILPCIIFSSSLHFISHLSVFCSPSL